MTPEQAKELQQTILWEGFCREVDKKIEYKAALLLVCSPEDLLALQYEIKALAAIKNIPQDVIDREE
jgi:hypothetical protein